MILLEEEMRSITKVEILEKIKLENPWWGSASINGYLKGMQSRSYIKSFLELVTMKDPNRAVVLMGPRRVGKTVMIHHCIQKLIESGTPPERICYISIDTPVYIGLGLEKLVTHYLETFKYSSPKNCYIFFDEIQYLKNWEVHLKKLVDDYRDAKFIASGSAAAALKLKSIESGAGRFTDFILPPLTFYEYIHMLNLGELIDEKTPDAGFTPNKIEPLNDEFIRYLNIGGYPEALFSESIKEDLSRFVKSDIIDKVLLRDLPNLYGVRDVQELNRFFSFLAYNTGNEVSLQKLYSGSEIEKNTINKYLEYLEASFLIEILHRVDQSGRSFKKANFFKIYLTNPSLRTALFGPISENHEFMGNIVETAIISQLSHSRYMSNYFYSRWRSGGEVDVVAMRNNRPAYCLEIKWSNRFFNNPEELKSLKSFLKTNKNKDITTAVTTRDKRGSIMLGGHKIAFLPASIYCYYLGESFFSDTESLRRLFLPFPSSS